MLLPQLGNVDVEAVSAEDCFGSGTAPGTPRGPARVAGPSSQWCTADNERRINDHAGAGPSMVILANRWGHATRAKRGLIPGLGKVHAVAGRSGADGVGGFLVLEVVPISDGKACAYTPGLPVG